MKEYTIIKPDPELKNNLMAFGFMCGEGWYPIIFECLDKIQKIVDETGLDTEVTEVKEKWGSLNIYLSGYTDEMYEATKQAERKSLETCEICGKEGRLISKNGWYMTRCSECERE